MHAAPRISAAVIMAAAGFAGLVGLPHGAAVAAACSSETYQWSGQASIAPGASVATGVVVPAQAGTELTVTGASADALDDTGLATALRISIGGTAASIGSLVAGGELVLHSAASTTVSAYGAAVTVQRCASVAQAGPVSPPSTPSTPSTPSSRSASRPSSAPSSGGAAQSLPATGVDVTMLAAAGCAMLLAGVTTRRLGVRGRVDGTA